MAKPDVAVQARRRGRETPQQGVAPRALPVAGTAVRPVLLAYGLLAGGLLAILASEYDPLSPLLPAALKVVLAVSAVTVAAVWCAGEPWRRWAPDLTAAVAGAYAGLTIATALRATPYPPFGLRFDAGFRIQAVSRFTDTWQLADLAYQGLPASYPPALPYLVGRAAWLTQTPPYLAWKYATVLAACAVPVLAYLLWRRILPASVAALLGLAVFVPMISSELIAKPDELLTLFLIVPWWLEAIYEIRPPHVRRWPPWVYGLIGALLFCTYYYFFFILAISLLLTPLLDRWHPPRPGAWRRRLAVVGVAALFSSVYWAPLLASIVRAQEPSFTQSQFFLDEHAQLPLPMFSVSVVGAVLLGGLCHAIWTARRDHVSGGLLLLVLAGYIWYVVGLLAAVLHHPVLVHHGEQFIVLVLAVAGIRAVTSLGAYLPRRWPHPQARAAVAAIGMGIAVLAGQNYTAAFVASGQVELAHNQPLPSGTLPRYHTGEADPPNAAFLNELRAAIRHDYQRPGHPVVLSERANLLDITPFYTFNQQSAIYANPAGEFRARLDLLRRLEATENPERFAHIATHNRFDAIDAMVLRITRHGLRYSVQTVHFPRVSLPVKFYFDRAQLAGRFWQVTHLDDYIVAVHQQQPHPDRHGTEPTRAT